jgi:hypothetical protein
MDETLKGRWGYRSFRNNYTLTNGQVKGELALPWAPPGVLEVDTDSAGTVTGTLTFTLPDPKNPGQTVKRSLKITGRVIPSAGPIPTSVELVGEGLNAIYNIKGFFIPRSGHVVGTVLNRANDLAQRPVGTVGPFVLIPNEP